MSRRPRKHVLYGPTWQLLNNLIKPYRHLFYCECCGRSPVTLHHIAPGFERHRAPEEADRPHFMMLLCHSCHYWSTRYPPQPWERERFVEWDAVVGLGNRIPGKAETVPPVEDERSGGGEEKQETNEDVKQASNPF